MAEKYNRKIFVQYDVSGWKNFTTQLWPDLNNNLRNRLDIFNSTAYAHQNGKPVICVWGIGVNDTNHVNNPPETLGVINVLKREFYVICGVPSMWRLNSGNSLNNYRNVYLACDMIQPWLVGVFAGVDGAIAYQQVLRADLTYCQANKIDYQPVIWPGFSWSNWNTGTLNQIPRLHGDFMWRQFVNLREIGIKNGFVAMFDEFDEGTAIAKAAETNASTPANQKFLTLDADGVRVSSDFYLRLNNDGKQMVLGLSPLVNSVPTSFFPNTLSQVSRMIAAFRTMFALF